MDGGSEGGEERPEGEVTGRGGRGRQKMAQFNFVTEADVRHDDKAHDHCSSRA